jgi:hypothetical protein
MATRNVNNVVIEGANIWARNFKGEEHLPYNPKGRRNFCLSLDPELAKDMIDEGWNVKYDRDDQPYIPVAVSYDKYPPKIYKVTSRGKTLLDEDLVGDLDDDEIVNVDLILRPYCWDVNGSSGVKAYVKDMYVTIQENALSDKYGD